MGDIREKIICFCGARKKTDHFPVLCVKADAAVVGEEGKYGEAVGFPECFTSSCFKNCLSKTLADSVRSFENDSSL